MVESVIQDIVENGAENVVLLALAVGLIVYLAYALLYPEKF